MAKATRLPASSERAKDKRRLHLREIKDDPHAQLDSVGATLRAARLNRGEDPDHVAAVLKMKREHVEAIEDNDFTRLPGRTYAIGFVRSYARYLGLDAEVMVQRFKEESAGREHDRPVQLVFPDAPEEKRTASGSFFLVVLLITAAIAGAYYVSIPQRHAAATPAGKAEEPAVVVNETPQPVDDASQGAAVSATLVQPAPLLTDAAHPGTDAATTSPALSAPAMPAEQAQVSAAATTAATAPGTPRVFGTENTGSRVVFRANAEAYILIKEVSPTGKVTLLDRTLAAGESYRAPNKPGILLITGNAGGLDVEIDGKKLGTVGKSGETLRNVPVDASYFVEHLASGTLAPAPAAPKPAAATAAPTTPKPATTAAVTPPATPKPAPTPVAPTPSPSAATPAPEAATTAPATPQ